MLIEQLCERRVLASVYGIVFEDSNLSWRYDFDEVLLPNRVVFVDSDDNGQIGENERVALTDDFGQFEFAELSGDNAIVRLFNGSPGAPLPLFPVSPVVVNKQLQFNGGTSIASLDDQQLIALAGNSIIRGNLETGISEPILIPGLVRAAQPLPGGGILVLASDGLGNESFAVTVAGAVTPIVLQATVPNSIWEDVAIDASGNGFLVERSNADTALRTIAAGETIQVSSTTTLVGAGTRVTSGGEITTVISTPTDDGLRLQLWSNATGTEISNGGVEIAGGIEVLSYDEATGLVFVRSTFDTVTILDAAADFASLSTIDAVGAVAIDGQRQLLFAISPTDPLLKIVDLNTAVTLGEFVFNSQSVSDVIEMVYNASTGELVVLTATGVSPITLRGAAVHRVRFDDENSFVDVAFALGQEGVSANTPPRFTELPVLTIAEDTILSIASPGFLEKAVDDQGDQFVVFLDTPTPNGIIVVTPTGGLAYIPNADFFGIDQFSVFLHDGRNRSEPIELSITVTPVDDPFDFEIEPQIIPEDAVVDRVVGDIFINEVDGGDIRWNINDPRFGVVGDQVVILPGSVFNSENEPFIDVEFTATESTSDEKVTKIIRFGVVKTLDLDVQIEPDSATIDENIPGELIAEIRVIDNGEGAQYEFTVDDDRFFVDFRDLRLKPGIALDFEQEQTVVVNITATSATGAFKTEPIVITVRDIGEQAASVELTSEVVIELVRGAVVGSVLVDGNLLSSGFIATVDDSRFEIKGSTLKLRASEFVRISEQEEIQVVVTIQDAASAFLPIAGTFVISVLANENPFHNPENPFDVNSDGAITPLDALLIINSMSRNGGPGPISGFPSPDRFYDVNGDGFITALDALLIINKINRLRRGEGEQPSDTTQPKRNDFGMIGPAVESSEKSDAEPVDQPSEPLSVAAKSRLIGETTDASVAELVEIRDDVIELLADDDFSSDSEVDAAINDFLINSPRS